VLAWSRLGEHGGLWLAVAGVGAACDPGRRARWMRAVRGVACAYGANTALKLLVRRRRPRLEGLPQLIGAPTQLSYPSAHAASSFAAARLLAPLLPRSVLWSAALAMALSRSYAGLHYPSDLVAGAALGVAAAELVP
jgi:undecaprenyl-diphosphatase